MKIKITTDLLSRRENKVIASFTHYYDNYEEALAYVIDTHDVSKKFLGTYVDISMEVIE